MSYTHQAINWNPRIVRIDANSTPQSVADRQKRPPSLRSRNGSHKSVRDSSRHKARPNQPQVASARSDFSNMGQGMGSQFGNGFEDPLVMDGHQHFDNAKKHFCDVLNCRYRKKSFSSHNDLIRHKKTTHHELKDGDELWRCPVNGCKTPNKLYPRLDNFKQHVARVHGEQYLAEAIKSTVIYRRRNLVPRVVDNGPPAASSRSHGSGQPLNLSSSEHIHDVRYNTNTASASTVPDSSAVYGTLAAHDMLRLSPAVSSNNCSGVLSTVPPEEQYQTHACDKLSSTSDDGDSVQQLYNFFQNGDWTLADSDGTLASSFGTSIISGTHETSNQVMAGDSGEAPLALNRPSTPKLQIDTSTPFRSRRRSHVSSVSQDNELLSPYYRPRTYRRLSSSSPINPPCDNLRSGQCSPETASDVSEVQLTPYEEEAAARLAWQILIICDGYAKECVQPAHGQAGGSNSGRALIPNQAPSGSGNRSNRSRLHGGGNDGGGGDQGHGNRLPRQAPAGNAGPTRRKWFACPYYKHDYRRFSQENENEGEELYRNCVNVSNRDVAQLKRHLYDRHARPDYYCDHCFQLFNSVNELVSHLERRCVSPGTPDPYDTLEMMTYRTRDLVRQKKRTPGASEEKYWYDIFRILFPREGRPDHPYIDVEYCRTVQVRFEEFLEVGPRAAQMIFDLYRPQRGVGATTILNVRVVDRAWALVQQLRSQPLPDPAAFAQFIGQRSFAWALEQQQRWTANNQPPMPSNNNQASISSNLRPATAYPMQGFPPALGSSFQTDPSSWNQQDSNTGSNAGTSFQTNSNSWSQQDSNMMYLPPSHGTADAGPNTQVQPVSQDNALAQVGTGPSIQYNDHFQSDERMQMYNQVFQAYNHLGNADTETVNPSLLANFDMQSTVGSQLADGGDTSMPTYDPFSEGTY